MSLGIGVTDPGAVPGVSTHKDKNEELGSFIFMGGDETGSTCVIKGLVLPGMISP
jgi:hypothetical protein